ncbi:MAG: DUF89 family protein [Oscillospiraceae bacterium]|nr:DUF89 family protein [Oscillospiraceae bacterium]
MSIACNTDCILCHMRRNIDTVRNLGTPEQLEEFTKGLLKLYLQIPEGASAVWTNPGTEALYRTVYGISVDRFAGEKAFSNRFVMERLQQLRARVEAAEDPVYAGLQFAVLGNYIDFSALHGEVSFEKLEQLLAQAQTLELDRQTYTKLCRDLEKGEKLLYLTDNAGEIGFDRICAEQIAKRYPHIQITFCVRGGCTLNDATREDAQAVEIPFPVIDNGNDIPGTMLDRLGDEARQAMKTADVIIAKGQANTETLLDCGCNVYYVFLIKCIRFMERFQKPKMTPMLVREKD